MIKTVGRFVIHVRLGGDPPWIDLDDKGQNARMLLSLEDLHDLIYIANSAMRCVEDRRRDPI